ncbi:hypothetical protein Pelo_16940 [Pelomyxa schiedti]|nr:hypothetical protein Pelo_16940 [Pelomyxa schiedti]
MVLAVAATSQRCGAHSPASIMGGHLVRQFWCDWVVGCSRVFVIYATVGEFWDEQVLCEVRVGVSVLLLGITQLWVRDANEPQAGWFGENNRIHCYSEHLLTPKGFTRIPSSSNGLALWNDECSAGSRDWELTWTNKNEDGGDDHSLVIQQLPGRRSSAGGEERRVSVEVSLLQQDFRNYIVESINLSEVNPSQAVLLLNSNDRTHSQLVVVDVPKSHAAGTLQVLSTTRCILQPDNISEELQEEHVIVVKCETGQNVFIVERYGCRKPSVVLSVQANSGVVKQLYADVEGSKGVRVLWEATEKEFSLYNRRCKTVEVWECRNNMYEDTAAAPPSPKTTIEHVGIPHIAGGGFIFHVTADTQALHVVEPSSGLTVASVDFLSPGNKVSALELDNNTLPSSSKMSSRSPSYALEKEPVNGSHFSRATPIHSFFGRKPGALSSLNFCFRSYLHLLLTTTIAETCSWRPVSMGSFILAERYRLLHSGNVAACKWILKTFNIPEPFEVLSTEIVRACSKHHVELVHWFSTFPSFQELAPSEKCSVFAAAASTWDLEFTKWTAGQLWSDSNFTNICSQLSEHATTPEGNALVQKILLQCCEKCDLEGAKSLAKLFSLTPGDMRFNCNLPLATCCTSGFVKGAQWLLDNYLQLSDLDAVNDHVRRETAFSRGDLSGYHLMICGCNPNFKASVYYL